MRIALAAVMFSVVTSVMTPATVQAGGWPGTGTYSLRADVPGGHTLKRLWSRINNR